MRGAPMPDFVLLLHSKVNTGPAEVAEETRDLLVGRQLTGHELTCAERKRDGCDDQRHQTRIEEPAGKVSD